MGQTILNHEVLNSWKQIDSERWSIIALEILEIFFKTAPPNYESLKQAFAEKDWNNLKALAHSLKSTCGNVGAESAHAILDAIEQGAGESSDELIINLEKLSIVFPEVLKQLEDFRKALQAQSA